jgi:hypothetical protein
MLVFIKQKNYQCKIVEKTRIPQYRPLHEFSEAHYPNLQIWDSGLSLMNSQQFTD